MPRTQGITDQAPPPVGPYSQSVRIANLVAASGQGGLTAETPDIESQTRLTLDRVMATLAASGAGSDDVIHVRVYLTDTSQFGPMNDVYAEYFTEPRPARTTVYCQLPPGMLIELDALAVLTTAPTDDPR